MMDTTRCDNCGQAPVKRDGRYGRCATYLRRYKKERSVKEPNYCECGSGALGIHKKRIEVPTRSGYSRIFDYFLCPACVKAEQYIEAVRL